METFARELARVSVGMAQHANRRTIKAEDIDMALKVMLSRTSELLKSRTSQLQ